MTYLKSAKKLPMALYEENLVSVVSADQKSQKIEKRERLGRLP